MPLDFCIFSSNGSPELGVALNPDEHSAILGLVDSQSLFARSIDFYADVDFLTEEIPLLLQQLTDLGCGMPPVGQSLLDLCEVAVKRGCGLSVIAD